MNWYKTQSIIQKESANWDKVQKGFWAGVAIGLASWLGLSTVQLQNLKSQFGNNEQALVNTLKQEVEKQGGNPDQILQQNSQNKINIQEQIPSVRSPLKQENEPANVNQKPNNSIEKEKDYYNLYINRMKEREGWRNKAYDDGIGIITVGVGHAMGKSPDSSNVHAKRSREVFKKLFGNSVNWDDVYNKRVSLTDSQVAALAKYDIEDHKNRAKSMFVNFENYPDYVQEALIDSVFRGDTGKATTALINQGNWRAAADEYINRKDYINAERNNMRGIKTRMDKNRAAFLQYAKELGQ